MTRSRLLVGYALLVTFVLGWAVASARIEAQASRQRFGEIDVERINIVDRDGRLRLVISNKERAPAPVVDGKTASRSGGNRPGLIFYNSEGDEVGGLVFDGSRTEAGHQAGAALLFDQFKQDQLVGIMYDEANGQRTAGLHVWDRADAPISTFMDRKNEIEKMPEGPAREEAMKAFRASLGSARRVFVGKTPDKTATVALNDPQGRPRVRLSVSGAGEPLVEILDAEGKAIDRLPRSSMVR
jgi:hypothetical protein